MGSSALEMIWRQKVSGPLRASPKKAMTLGVLIAVLVSMWIYKVCTGTSSPSSASAAPITTTSAVGKNSSTPHNAGGNPSLMAWARAPVGPIGRNLFAVPLDYYPRDGTAGRAVESGTDGFWDRVAKSMNEHADQQEQRQNLLDNILNQAAALKLQSTMMGSQPSAMVNGEVVQEGSVVAGFSVLKIEAHEIIVEREGIRLEILMK